MGRHWQATDDLALFKQIVDVMPAKRSLRELGIAIGMPHQTVHDLLTRLEKHFGETLIERPPQFHEFRLTAFGDELKKRLANCLKPFDQALHPLKIIVAQSLMHNRRLMTALTTDAVAIARNTQCLLELQANVDVNDEQEIENLITSRLDLLVCWGFPQRKQRFTSTAGLKVTPLGRAYPIALVCHSTEILKRCIKSQEGAAQVPWEPSGGVLDFEELVNNKIAVLDHGKQPFGDELVAYGLYESASKRVRSHSFPMIIDLVRNNMADLGFVPLVSRELDSYRISGDIDYQVVPSMLNGVSTSVEIIAVTHSKATKGGRKGDAKNETKRSNSISQIITALADYSVSTDGVWDAFLEELPFDPAFFNKLRYGYYLYSPDANRRASDEPSRTDWHWESIDSLQLELSSSKTMLTMAKDAKPSINNDRHQTYVVRQAYVADGAFVLRAKETWKSGKGDGRAGFVSVFSAAVRKSTSHDEAGDASIVVGTWNGTGGRRTSLHTWSTILSSEELSKEQLNSISRIASSKFVFTAQLDSITTPLNQAQEGSGI